MTGVRGGNFRWGMRGVLVMLCMAAAVTGAIPRASAQESPDARIREARRLFDVRAAEILAQYDTVTGADYYACAVQFRNGTATARTRENALRLLADPSGDVFWMVNVTALALHAGKGLPREIDSAIDLAWRSYTPYRGDTENHWLMYYASILLETERRPDIDVEYPVGVPLVYAGPYAEQYLRWWFAKTAREGLSEFDSPVYMPVYMAPLLLVHDFARDSAMRAEAGRALDRIVGDFAAAQVDGMYGGAQARATDATLLRPKRSAASGMAWLYFGADGASRTQAEVLAALSMWRPSDAVLRRALDRRQPYELRTRVWSRPVLRRDDGQRRTAMKTLFATRAFVLGSLDSGIVSPIQQHSWSLVMATSDENASIFGGVPYWSADELAAFFPEEPKTLLSQVVGAKPSYADPAKWEGGSPFERTWQRANRLLVEWDVPPDAPVQRAKLHVPATLDTLVFEGEWIFFREGESVGAMHVAGGCDTVRVGDHIRVDVRGARAWLMLEVHLATDIGSLSVLRTLRSGTRPDPALLKR